jgi:hypothetical protein
MNILPLLPIQLLETTMVHMAALLPHACSNAQLMHFD